MNKLGKIFIILGISFIFASLCVYSFYTYISNNAEEESFEALENLKNIDNEDENDKFAYIDGYDYMGIIYIPTIDLELPIMANYDTVRLRKAPCKYYGSIETNDLIICGHSYKSHFGNLSKLSKDDKIIFTDIDKNEYIYEVVEMEILNATDIDKMINTDYDLTLYTCTPDSARRITIRCNRTN